TIADAVEEVAQVLLLRTALLAGRLRLPPAGRSAIDNMPTLAIDDQCALFAVQDNAERLALGAGLRPDAMLPDDRRAGEIVGGGVRGRRLLIVVVEELAAAAGDARRSVEAGQHADQVEGVDAVVAQLAGAVVPVPVPVVMEAVGVEGTFRSRSEPQIV